MNGESNNPVTHRLVTLVRQTLEKAGPELLRGEPLMIGVSGGPDSMALLDLLREIGLSPFVAHVNYQLRGGDSEKDQQLVEAMCLTWGFDFAAFRPDPSSVLQGGGNLQNWARQERYRIFREVAAAEGMRYILTAHHQDDQLETILQRLLRGSGMAGWKGMQIRSGDLIRPLLDVSKQELLEYLQVRGIPYRIDISNQEAGYARNLLRNNWFPGMEEFFPGWKSNLLALRDRAVEMETLCDLALAPLLDRSVDGDAGMDRPESELTGSERASPKPAASEFPMISFPGWCALPEAVRGVVLLRWIERSQPDVRRDIRRPSLDGILAHLPGLQTGKSVQLTENAMLLRDRDRLRLITSVKAVGGLADDGTTHHGMTVGWSAEWIPLSIGEERSVHLQGSAGVILSLNPVHDPDLPKKVSNTPDELWIDADPLYRAKKGIRVGIRRWRDGDRFSPLGIPGGTQLVSDHLTNRKISGPERIGSLVLLDPNEKILGLLYGWVGEPIGVPDDASKCTPLTRLVLRIRRQ